MIALSDQEVVLSLSAACAAAGAATFLRAVLSRKVLQVPACRRCRYPLDQPPLSVCPECGTSAASNPPRMRGPLDRRLAVPAALLGALSVLLAGSTLLGQGRLWKLLPSFMLVECGAWIDDGGWVELKRRAARSELTISQEQRLLQIAARVVRLKGRYELRRPLVEVIAILATTDAESGLPVCRMILEEGHLEEAGFMTAHLGQCCATDPRFVATLSAVLSRNEEVLVCVAALRLHKCPPSAELADALLKCIESPFPIVRSVGYLGISTLGPHKASACDRLKMMVGSIEDAKYAEVIRAVVERECGPIWNQSDHTGEVAPSAGADF